MARLLGATPRETATLRERIEAGETVLAPGCYDAPGAWLVEETGLPVATQAMRAALARVKADGSPIELVPSLLPFDDFLSFIGLPEMRELERRFAEE